MAIDDTNEFFDKQVNASQNISDVAQTGLNEVTQAVQKLTREFKNNDDKGDKRNRTDRGIQIKTLFSNQERNKLLRQEREEDKREEKERDDAALGRLTQLSEIKGVSKEYLPAQLKVQEAFSDQQNKLVYAAARTAEINEMQISQMEKEALRAQLSTELAKKNIQFLDENQTIFNEIKSSQIKYYQVSEEFFGAEMRAINDQTAILQNLTDGDEEERLKEIKRQAREQRSREKTNKLLDEQTSVLRDLRPKGFLGFLSFLLGIPIAAAGITVGFLQGLFGFFKDLNAFLSRNKYVGKLYRPLERGFTRLFGFFRSVGDFFTGKIGNFLKRFDKLRKGFLIGLIVFQQTFGRLTAAFKNGASVVKGVLLSIKNFLFGPDSLFGFLSEQLKKVFPPKETKTILGSADEVAKTGKSMGTVLRRTFTVFKTIGSGLGRLTGIGTIIFGVIDAFLGVFKKFKEGFKADTLLGQIFEGVLAAVNGLISGFVGGILNLIGMIVGFILKLFGLEEVGAKVMEFDFIDAIFGMIDSIFSFVNGIIDTILKIGPALAAAAIALPPGGKKPEEEFMRVMGASSFKVDPEKGPKSYVLGMGLLESQDELDATTNANAQAKAAAIIASNTKVDNSTVNQNTYVDEKFKIDRTSYQFGAPFTGLVYQ